MVATLAVATGLLVCTRRHAGRAAAIRSVANPITLDDAIAQLEGDLARDPNQVEGWRLLGRAYAERQQAGKARDAYARAAKLAPDDADIAGRAMPSRARLPIRNAASMREAIELLRDALQRNPRHQRARWFLGIAQRQAGQPAEAARTWEPLLAQVDASTAAALRPQSTPRAPKPACRRCRRRRRPRKRLHRRPAATRITVKVALDPDFAARVRLRGDASVFVIARMPGGPPMPVAVEKHSLQDLPLEVTLDDADSPMPTQKLSALKEVELVARLSASGNAMRQEGDLESKACARGPPLAATRSN